MTTGAGKGRRPNGQFEKGHSGNPGGMKKGVYGKQARYLDIILSAVTFQDWRAIVEKAADQAKNGDRCAREWLSSYLAPIAQLLRIEGLVGVGTPQEVLDALDRIYGEDSEGE